MDPLYTHLLLDFPNVHEEMSGLAEADSSTSPSHDTMSDRGVPGGAANRMSMRFEPRVPHVTVHGHRGVWKHSFRPSTVRATGPVLDPIIDHWMDTGSMQRKSMGIPSFDGVEQSLAHMEWPAS
jgi:hypothetical protein